MSPSGLKGEGFETAAVKRACVADDLQRSQPRQLHTGVKSTEGKTEMDDKSLVRGLDNMIQLQWVQEVLVFS